MNKCGRLPLHLERRAHPYEGVHNLWTPLLPEGKFVNVDCPGLQLLAGRLPFFQALSSETEPDILAYMSSMGPKSLSPDAPGDEYGFFLRPALKTADVVIFSGFVPHGSYLPPESGITRVCFDMRTFPGEQRPEKLAHIEPRKLAIN